MSKGRHRYPRHGKQAVLHCSNLRSFPHQVCSELLGGKSLSLILGFGVRWNSAPVCFGNRVTKGHCQQEHSSSKAALHMMCWNPGNGVLLAGVLAKGRWVKAMHIAYLASGAELWCAARWWKSCCGVGWLPLSAGLQCAAGPFSAWGGADLPWLHHCWGLCLLSFSLLFHSPLPHPTFPMCWRLLRTWWAHRSLKWNWWGTAPGALHTAPPPAFSCSTPMQGTVGEMYTQRKQIKVKRNMGLWVHCVQGLILRMAEIICCCAVVAWRPHLCSLNPLEKTFVLLCILYCHIHGRFALLRLQGPWQNIMRGR